jgi:ParB-like chromosome segregation protein Spo0J
MKAETVPIDSIHADPANVRRHPERNLDAIKASLARFGQVKPIVVDAKGIVRAGNGTLEAARALGWDTIAVVRTGLKGSEATAYAIADNRTAELAEWDDIGLAETLRALQSEDFDLAAVGYDAAEVDALIAGLANDAIVGDGAGTEPEPRATLAERFGVPPFSVLDARQGYWQDRKRAWIALGIQSELGRGGEPGGSPRPAARLTESGHTMRGNGVGRPLQ